MAQGHIRDREFGREATLPRSAALVRQQVSTAAKRARLQNVHARQGVHARSPPAHAHVRKAGLRLHLASRLNG